MKTLFIISLLFSDFMRPKMCAKNFGQKRPTSTMSTAQPQLSTKIGHFELKRP